MTIYALSSADAGAPVLSASAGAMCALLDAVLVNGYGTHPGMGWTIAFTDTNKRAYRMPAGTSQRYLRVDDTAPSASTTAFGAPVEGYDSMTDIDTGLGPIAVPSPGPIYLQKSNQNTTDAREWRFFSDGQFFLYFPKWVPTTYDAALAYFGDVKTPGGLSVPFVTALAARTATSGGSQPGLAGTSGLRCDPGNYAGLFPNWDNTQTSCRYHQSVAPNQTPNTYVYGASGYSSVPASGVGTLLTPLELVPDDAVNSGKKWYAGSVPGIYVSVNESSDYADGDIIPAPAGSAIAGRDLMVVKVEQNKNVYVDVTGPWR